MCPRPNVVIGRGHKHAPNIPAKLVSTQALSNQRKNRGLSVHQRTDVGGTHYSSKSEPGVDPQRKGHLIKQYHIDQINDENGDVQHGHDLG